MSKKKLLSPQQKVMVLRELLENQTPMSQLAEKYGIHINDIYNWRKKLFEQAADDIFTVKSKHSRINESKQQEKNQQLEQKIKQKDEVIAELVLENITLKKNIDGTI
jgi:transposase